MNRISIFVAAALLAGTALGQPALAECCRGTPGSGGGSESGSTGQTHDTLPAFKAPVTGWWHFWTTPRLGVPGPIVQPAFQDPNWPGYQYRGRTWSSLSFTQGLESLIHDLFGVGRGYDYVAPDGAYHEHDYPGMEGNV